MCVFLTSLNIVIAICRLSSALEIVTRLFGLLKVDAGMRTRRQNRNLRRLHRLYLHRRYPFRLAKRQCQVISRAPRVICLRIYIFFYYKFFKSRPILDNFTCCLLLLPFWDFFNCSMFCCKFLYVPSSFAILLMRKRVLAVARHYPTPVRFKQKCGAFIV